MRNKIRQRVLMFGACVALGLGLTFGALADDPAFLHKQDPNPAAQVHAQGDASAPFWSAFKAPADITTDGHHLDKLYMYVSWTCFVFFLIMAFGMLYFVLANRERPGHTALYTHGYSKWNSIITKALDVVVFVTLDIVVWWSSLQVSYNFIWKYPQGQDVVRIQVMPQQWAWNFRYPGKNGFGSADDVVTLNELKVPKGKKVMMELKSRDVIHGFWAPNLRRQVDALPGAVTRFWFDTTKTGDFEIACAHLCGTAHYKMKAFLTVLEPADYEAWLKERSQWAAAKYDPAEKQTQWGWKWSSN